MFLGKENINPYVLCNVLAPIFICGFLGNILCIVVFLRRRFRSRSISVYFIALFFNDCLLLFISHVGKMLIFDASSSCWFNIYLSKFIDLIRYRDVIYHGGLSVLTYNTTYSQISMLIFMFMSIQRVRTFSSISYRESRTCASLLTLIAFVYGLLVSYVQLYDTFCVEQFNLTTNQSEQIDALLDDTRRHLTNRSSLDLGNQSTELDWRYLRHRTIARVYLPSYMSIDWPDEHAQPTPCDLEDQLPEHLLASIDNLTRPLLQTRPGEDYFLEHQFCTQAWHFIDAYGNCSLPLSARSFQRFYTFLYDRRLSFSNRYTIGFIIGTLIPSCICIFSSLICLYYISNRPLIRKHSHSRAELRSLSMIFVEILLSLMSALQSYMINFFTCHRLLFRMGSDNCYGQASNNILPNFLGSILELFTSTSNILILMICGAQFRNELIEILHLRKVFPERKQPVSSRDDQTRTRPRSSGKALPLRVMLSSVKTTPISEPTPLAHDPSMDSFQNREEISLTDTEQQSDETSQCLIKLTAV